MKLPFPIDYIGQGCIEAILLTSVIFLLYNTLCSITVWGYVIFVIIYATYRTLTKIREDKRVVPSNKYVVITGCDTGIGFGCARRLDRQGFHVIATCLDDTCDGAKKLRTSGSQRMRVLQLDVTSDVSLRECLSKVREECQHVGLWALVNNAGAAMAGDIEVQPMSSFKFYAEINLFGMIRVTKAFLPLIRTRRGRVVNNTSVRGRLAFPSAATYCVSKFGAEGFSDCLRLEMERFGVRVIVIEIGKYGLQTGQFTESNRDKIRLQCQRMIDALDPEVHEAYGDAHVRRPITHALRAEPFSEEGIRVVMDTMEAAVAGMHPRSRYLVDSNEKWIDSHCMLARCRSFLPEYILDRLLLDWVMALPRTNRPSCGQ